jgi:branched-chain amino acid transport system ATP-binding protein
MPACAAPTWETTCEHRQPDLLQGHAAAPGKSFAPRQEGEPMNVLLEIEGLEVAYGPSQVLFGLNLALADGEAATLLGRNGMGKTTTLRAICGLQPLKAGSIRFAGQRIDGWRPDRIGRAGIALVPEGRQCFPNLTVHEHLVAFQANRCGSAGPWTPAGVYELFPRLRERTKNLGNQLSGGEQQMLAIGRALVTNPRLLILDEATEGLAPLIRDEIWACLARLRAAGQSVLVIDKYVEKLIELADHHTIVERGRVVWQGASAELDADHGIWQRYLGL